MKDEYIIKVQRAVGAENAASPGEPVYLHVKKGYFANVTNSLQGLPSNVELIDESNQTALPGLIDMHVHLTREEAGAEINLAPLYLAHGVTSVRDVGSDLQTIKRMRSEVESGAVPGPRIFFCGPQLNGKAFRLCFRLAASKPRRRLQEFPIYRATAYDASYAHRLR